MDVALIAESGTTLVAFSAGFSARLADGILAVASFYLCAMLFLHRAQLVFASRLTAVLLGGFAAASAVYRLPAVFGFNSLDQPMRIVAAVVATGCACGAAWTLRRAPRDEARERYSTPTSGRRRANCVACSNARARARTSASRWRRPTICRPTGSPLAENPQGTLIAGRPVQLIA